MSLYDKDFAIWFLKRISNVFVNFLAISCREHLLIIPQVFVVFFFLFFFFIVKLEVSMLEDYVTFHSEGNIILRSNTDG